MSLASTTPPRPFFTAPGDNAGQSRRLLLISMAFPPDQCTGALRWQKLSHFVAERGWQLDVITVDPSSLESVDASRLEELPAGTRVYGVSMPRLRIERAVGAAVRGSKWLQVLRHTRRTRGANGAAPTSTTCSSEGTPPAPSRPGSFARGEIRWNLTSRRGLVRAYQAFVECERTRRWACEAESVARRVVDRTLHEVVITSGPPHMAHVAGERVARATGLPFVMDMRDPWALVQRLPESIASAMWFWFAERYERQVVEGAALVATNTEAFRLAMSARYPGRDSQVLTVMNGCDDDPLPESENSDCFRVAFAGEIYLDRDPRPLFAAAAQVIRELGLGPAQFAIEMIGAVDQYGAKPVAEIAREEGIAEFVTLGPARPRRDALSFLSRAAVLVSLPQDSDMAIPAKIFEYIQFNAWVLAMATPESATGRLLANSPADVVTPGDRQALAAILREHFLQHARGERPPRIADDPRFSRRVQAERLLDEIAKHARRSLVSSAGADRGLGAPVGAS
jgi:hypothetical protein